MPVSTDYTFKIGKTHSVCQDYARSGSVNEVDYIILSDGCSTAPDTDIGARALVIATENEIRFKTNNFKDWEFSIVRVLDNLKKIGWSLPIKTFSATLLVGIMKDEWFYGYIFGDGMIAGKQLDGNILACWREFPSGAPYHPVYELEGKEDYLEQFSNSLIDSTQLIGVETEPCKSSFLIDPCWHMQLPVEEFSSISLFSDGIFSFTDVDRPTSGTLSTKKVDFKEVLQEVLAFKNTNGQFVQRRVNRAFSEYEKKGRFHQDDFSMTTMSITR
mgnify:FL=1